MLLIFKLFFSILSVKMMVKTFIYTTHNIDNNNHNSKFFSSCCLFFHLLLRKKKIFLQLNIQPHWIFGQRMGQDGAGLPCSGVLISSDPLPFPSPNLLTWMRREQHEGRRKNRLICSLLGQLRCFAFHSFFPPFSPVLCTSDLSFPYFSTLFFWVSLFCYLPLLP